MRGAYWHCFCPSFSEGRKLRYVCLFVFKGITAKSVTKPDRFLSILTIIFIIYGMLPILCKWGCKSKMYYLDWQAKCFLIISLAANNVWLLYLFDLYGKSTESAWLGERFGLQGTSSAYLFINVWSFSRSPPLWQHQAVKVHVCKPICRRYCMWCVECIIWCSTLLFVDVFVWRIWLNELSY